MKTFFLHITIRLIAIHQIPEKTHSHFHLPVYLSLGSHSKHAMANKQKTFN